MASNYTEHYDLCQWEATDQVQRTDFNADNAKLDAALDALAGQVAEKADGDDLAALSETVAGHTAALAGCGNCQIYTTTYVGDGTKSRTYTFPGTPLAVLISGPSIHILALYSNSHAMSLLSGDYWSLSAAWSGNTLTLAYTGSFGGGEEKMGNELDRTYYMVIFMNAENE